MESHYGTVLSRENFLCQILLLDWREVRRSSSLWSEPDMLDLVDNSCIYEPYLNWLETEIHKHRGTVLAKDLGIGES